MTEFEALGGRDPAPAPEPLASDIDSERPLITVPPAQDLPGEQDLTAPRLAAALIDIGLLIGLFVIMAAVVGRFSVGGGSFGIFLSLPWTVLYLAVLLLYYFVLETLTGQTVGKVLMGVRVLRTDGSRPSAAAIAGRTLLRIIDWLPVLYLVGFIAMVTTGARRQRLGDQAASTCVARALPSQRRGLAFIPLAVVLLAAAGLSVYRVSSGAQTYHANGVSFGYPAGWHEENFRQIGGGGAKRVWTTTVGPGTPLDLVTVTAYSLNIDVTAQNIDAITPDLQRAIQQALGQVGGSVQAGPEKITMAGLPGVRFGGTGTIHGSSFDSTLVFAFSGSTEYFVNCQYTSAETADVQQACNQVVSSFKVGG